MLMQRAATRDNDEVRREDGTARDAASHLNYITHVTGRRCSMASISMSVGQ